MSDIDDKDFVWITANKLFDDYKIKCDPKESVFNLPKSERLELLNFILKQTKPMKKTNAQLLKEIETLKEANKSLHSTVGTLNEVSDRLSKEKKELEKNQTKPQPFEIIISGDNIHIPNSLNVKTGGLSLGRTIYALELALASTKEKLRIA